jgi:hypothetical protein
MSAAGKIGLAQGLLAGEAEARRRSIQDAGLADAKAEKERTRKRQDDADARQKETQARADADFEATRKLRDLEIADAERKMHEAAARAEDEGIISLAIDLKAGIDPELARHRFNRHGDYQLQEGDLAYDPVN